MIQEDRRSPFKKWTGIIFLFVLGMGIGAAMIFFSQDTIARQVLGVESGKILDLDRLHLVSGDVLTGEILAEEGDEVVVGLERGTLRFKRNEISRIDKNYLTRYLKQAW